MPLLPVQTDAGLRLKRGKVLKPDGTQEFVEAQGRLLNPPGVAAAGLIADEEEIPREGVRVTRTYQLARWQDGAHTCGSAGVSASGAAKGRAG